MNGDLAIRLGNIYAEKQTISNNNQVTGFIIGQGGGELNQNNENVPYWDIFALHMFQIETRHFKNGEVIMWKSGGIYC